MVETMNTMDGESRFDDTRYDSARFGDRYRSEHDMEYLNEVKISFSCLLHPGHAMWHTGQGLVAST